MQLSKWLILLFIVVPGCTTYAHRLQRGDVVHRKLSAPFPEFFGKCKKFTFITSQATDNDNKVVILIHDCGKLHLELDIWSAEYIEEAL